MDKEKEQVTVTINGIKMDEKTYEYILKLGYKLGCKERKQGEWIGEEEGYYSECSCCGASFLWEDYKYIGDWKYCPKCGAEMRGSENE